MQWYRFRIVSGDKVTYHDQYFDEMNHWEIAQELKKRLEKNGRKVSYDTVESRSVKYGERMDLGDDIKNNDLSLEDLFTEAKRLGIDFFVYYNNVGQVDSRPNCFRVYEGIPKRIYLNGEWSDEEVKRHLKSKLEKYAKSTWQLAYYNVAKSKL